MKYISMVILLACILVDASAKNSVEMSYESLDFIDSKKKEDGKRFGVKGDYDGKFQFYYEQTRTNTTPIVAEDLRVDKFTFKYNHSLSNGLLSALFINVDDSLNKEADGVKVYGLGYAQNGLSFTQYLSDYKHFDVYQSDVAYNIKKDRTKFTLIGKYIYVKNKNSNLFSKNAKVKYYTLGMKVHTHYKEFHFGAGAYFGNRIFSVMRDGFKVQHHAMEFKKSYMCGVGYNLQKDMLLKVMYSYHLADEVPVNNNDVEIHNVVCSLKYTF